MGRAHKRGSEWSRYEMDEGKTVDGTYTLHETRGCGRHRGRGFLRFLILLLILGAVFGHMHRNERRVEAVAMRAPVAAIPAAPAAPLEQGPFDDQTVAGGETIDGDLVNYSGNVTVQDGGVIDGDLVLFSGNAVIEPGGVVEGDLTVWSGNATVRGTVEGDIAAMSGNVYLQDGAVVGGDVSSFSGNIERTGAVSVDGDVVSGIGKGMPFWRGDRVDLSRIPAIANLPDAPDAPEAPNAVVVRDRSENFSLFERMIFLFGRLIVAVVVTVAISLFSMGIFSLRPNALTVAYGRMRESMRGSFALGAVTNFGLLIAMRALFAVGFCFAPIAVVTFLGLVALVTLGYGIVARQLGTRVLDTLNRRSSASVERKPIMEVGVGALVMTGALAFLSAITASTWVFAIGVLLVSAPGVGALIKPWIDRVRNRKTQDLTSPGARTAAASSAANASAFGSKYPMPAAAAAGAAASATIVKPYAPARPVQPAPYGSATATAPASSPLSAQDVALQSTTPVTTDLSAVEGTSATASASTGSEWVLEPPTSLQSAQSVSGAPYSLDLPEQTSAPAGTPGVTVEDLVNAADADKAARDAVKAAEVAARERLVDVSIGDDLTRITGLGKSSERKLKGAGIVTFAQLAAVPAEMVATILGVPVEEVIEDEIVKQAGALAGG